MQFLIFDNPITRILIIRFTDASSIVTLRSSFASEEFVMKRFFFLQPHLRPALLGATAAFVIGGCATQMETKPATGALPANLAPAANEQQVLRLPAIGVQIYECKAVDGKLPAWVFVAPEADLFDEAGARVGKHYAGPTWEMNDGSKIVGTVKERANSTVPGAIPWLLLTAKSTGTAGKLEKISSLQRANTVGGVAPTGGCSAADIGKQARVYYKADYVYYAAK
jgi:Protein of unknown function (DUF3455)